MYKSFYIPLSIKICIEQCSSSLEILVKASSIAVCLSAKASSSSSRQVIQFSSDDNSGSRKLEQENLVKTLISLVLSTIKISFYCALSAGFYSHASQRGESDRHCHHHSCL